MTNPTDPEEIRLRSKVADLQIHISDCLIVGDLTGKEAAEAECRDIVGRIQDMRTKASAPEPAPPHEPPEGFQRIASAPKDGTPIWTWHRLWDRGETIGRFHRGTEWVGIDRQSGEFGFGIPPSHWAPIAPALPNTPQVPTHESIIQWAKEKDKESLRTGRAVRWTELIPDFARVFGLATPDERVEPTDENIEHWLAYYGLIDNIAVDDARDLLFYFSTPPVPAGEITEGLEPPDAFRSEKWHWLVHGKTPFPAMWYNQEWSAPGSDTLDPDFAARFGWKYLMPLIPPERGSQGLCETTLTERFENPNCFCQTYEGNLGPCKTFEAGAKYGVCVYCDHTLTCHTRSNESITDGGLGQEKASEPASTAGITDDEIVKLSGLFQYVGDDSNNYHQIVAFARTHLAKRSSATSLSNETLRDLWRLAHQEALDQFVTDAKGIIGR